MRFLKFPYPNLQYPFQVDFLKDHLVGSFLNSLVILKHGTSC